APTVTTVVPAGMGTTIPLSKGGYFGWVEDAIISPLIQGLLANYLPNELPIFVTDNVEGSVNGIPSYGGFHHSDFGVPDVAAQTFIFSGYIEPGTTDPGFSFFEDTYILSHEVAEWLNDPFPLSYVGNPPDFSIPGANVVPPALLSPTFCNFLFEVGDALEA